LPDLDKTTSAPPAHGQCGHSLTLFVNNHKSQSSSNRFYNTTTLWAIVLSHRNLHV